MSYGAEPPSWHGTDTVIAWHQAEAIRLHDIERKHGFDADLRAAQRRHWRAMDRLLPRPAPAPQPRRWWQRFLPWSGR